MFGFFADNNKHVNAGGGGKEESVGGELDAWSAHRSETGILYYYNAVTGQSTYHKPAGFKGEVHALTCVDFSLFIVY